MNGLYVSLAISVTEKKKIAPKNKRKRTLRISMYTGRLFNPTLLSAHLIPDLTFIENTNPKINAINV